MSLARIFQVFFMLGATGFGTSMLPYLRTRLVDGLGWVEEDEFLRAVTISQTLPGLNATNMCVIVGDRLAGPAGSVVATLALLLPGAILLCLMGTIFAAHHKDPLLDVVLDAVAAGSAGLLLATVWRLGKKQLLSRQLLIVLATAVAVSYFKLSLPLVLLLLAPLSIWMCRPRETR